MDTQKLSRARVSKPRGLFSFVGKLPFHRRSLRLAERPGFEPSCFACRASTAGRAKKKNDCTLECNGHEAFVKGQLTRLVSIERQCVWARCDGACEIEEYDYRQSRETVNHSVK